MGLVLARVFLPERSRQGSDRPAPPLDNTSDQAVTVVDQLP